MNGTNRRLYVTANGLNSDINSIKCGVPQGSVLGPLLFLLYVNDIGNCVPHIPVKLDAYYTNVFIHGKMIHNLMLDAEMHIAKLSNWFSNNKLSLSIDKTCYSTFSVTDCTRKNIQLILNNTAIKPVESTKYLGIIIDSNLPRRNMLITFTKKFLSLLASFL